MREVEIDDRAVCLATDVGDGTRVAAFAQVCEGVSVGEGCSIADGAFLGAGVRIGDRVSIGSGAYLPAGVTVGANVRIGPKVTFSDEPPEPGEEDLAVAGEDAPRTSVGAGAMIGAAATIAGGLAIGRGAKVGAGAVVTRSIPPNAIVLGNPAHIVGYTRSRTHGGEGAIAASTADTTSLDVGGARLTRSPEFTDLRGSLTVGELPQDDIPFIPKRWFLVYDVPNQEVRGEHAHHVCHQFLVCVSGTMTVVVDDGERRAAVSLDSRVLGLYIPPLVWASQYRFSADAVLLVLASHHYDAADYIRDYDEFLAASRS
ncbi:MAG TPA: WxcM-like domain-containing protein [Solirubrobacteraceae bacterium]|nr:WxcM-like domain-containing protein [Solirubrobacteraceae bacterium]